MPKVSLKAVVEFSPLTSSDLLPGFRERWRLPFTSERLEWKGPAPDLLKDVTLKGLSLMRGVEVKVSLRVFIAGRTAIGVGQDWCGERSPSVGVTIGKQRKLFLTKRDSGRTPTTVRLNGTTVFDSLGDVEIRAVQSHSEEINHWSDMVFKITMEVEAVVNCTGPNLVEAGICLDWCSSSPGECLDDYNDYCFPRRIGTSEACRVFTANRIRTKGPDEKTDRLLKQYCQDRYAGLAELIEGGDPTDRELCACHMKPELYRGIRDLLEAQRPSLSDPTITDACLVPQCYSSPFKSIESGRVCAETDIGSIEFRQGGGFSSMKMMNEDIEKGKEEVSGSDRVEEEEEQQYISDRTAMAIVAGGTIVMVLLFIFVMAEFF